MYITEIFALHVEVIKLKNTALKHFTGYYIVNSSAVTKIKKGNASLPFNTLLLF